mgnify:CR=1 FL=1
MEEILKMENGIIINGNLYVRKIPGNEMQYVICRTYSAGVFAGFLEKREGDEVLMRQARRIWYWSGAASLSQLAMEGTSKPGDCKFPIPVNSILLIGVIEILECTEKAIKSISEVPVWKK